MSNPIKPKPKPPKNSININGLASLNSVGNILVANDSCMGAVSLSDAITLSDLNIRVGHSIKCPYCAKSIVPRNLIDSVKENSNDRTVTYDKSMFLKTYCSKCGKIGLLTNIFVD